MHVEEHFVLSMKLHMELFAEYGAVTDSALQGVWLAKLIMVHGRSISRITVMQPTLEYDDCFRGLKRIFHGNSEQLSSLHVLMTMMLMLMNHLLEPITLALQDSIVLKLHVLLVEL